MSEHDTRTVRVLFSKSVPLNEDKTKTLIFEVVEYPDTGRVVIIRKRDVTKSNAHFFNQSRIHLSYATFQLLKSLLDGVDIALLESVMKKHQTDLDTETLAKIIRGETKV